MATTTPNFGWPVPTSTDLVKNGATAIEGLGDAIDASLLDLKGGTTNQVLAKNSNTDMDFKWVADSAGMTNPMTTTGDTIYSSSGSTPARLGIGSTGQVLTVAAGLPSWATPSSSAFVGCSLENASTVLSNNTDTILTFTGELYDTDAMHSTSSNTGRITIPSGKGGYYEFRWSMVFDNNSSGNRRVRLLKNGSGYEFGPILTIKGDGLTGLSNSSVVSTVAGDYWELQAFQDSGGSLNVGVGGSLMFQANKVG